MARSKSTKRAGTKSKSGSKLEKPTRKLRGSIKLSSGREIHLRRIIQSLVYEGLAEGFPDKEFNESRIKDSVANANEQLGTFNTHVLKPKNQASKT